MGQAGAAAGWHPLKALLRHRSESGAPSLVKWLSHTTKMAVLLVLILAALLSTALLAPEYQIFLLKIFLVTFLSLLPGWLYLHFIRSRGIGLYDEYVLNLYRLRIDSIFNLPKPPPGSSYWPPWDKALGHADDRQVARNVYLKKFESVYGRSAIPPSRRKRDSDDLEMEDDNKTVERLKADAFSPVVWTTLVLAIGWIVVIQPELFKRFEPLGRITISGLPSAPVTALRFGFLGAYVFILQGLVRRYFQIDLKTQAYVAATSRVVIVAAIVLALGPVLEGRDQLIVASVAFLVGIFPELGLRLMKRAGSILGRKVTRLPDEQRFPLTDLDGIDLWSRARLAEEGIEDMENLTTASLPDLMLNTRMPLQRLIDWIDQSFLYLRVENGKHEDRAKLRRIGIRSATDLLDAFGAGDGLDPTFRPRLLRLLNSPQDEGPSVTEGLRRSLEGEVNLWHVRQWKKREWLEHAAIEHGPSKRDA